MRRVENDSGALARTFAKTIHGCRAFSISPSPSVRCPAANHNRHPERKGKRMLARAMFTFLYVSFISPGSDVSQSAYRACVLSSIFCAGLVYNSLRHFILCTER